MVIVAIYVRTRLRLRPQGVWYDVHVKYDGSNVTVSRRVRGSGTGYTEVLVTSNAQVTSAERMRVAIHAGADYSFDDFTLLADGGAPFDTITYTYNAANELTAMADPNGTTSFSYEAWGRLTGKTRGAHSAAYDWAYGGKLAEAASGFPDEGTVAYEYGGDGKRRVREPGSAYTWYNWAGWQVLSEQDAEGDLARTYVGRTLAHIDGDTPATGTAQYYLHDHLGSARQLRAAGGALTAAYDYSPYGEVLGAPHPAHTTRQFTGHDWDPAAGLHFAPFRYYSPAMARWLSRDPLGMVDGPNVYHYALGHPVRWHDPFGLHVWIEGPSGREPSGHLSICVGDPFGIYDAYSFGLWIPPIGRAYRDWDTGGTIVRYMPTTQDQDRDIRMKLERSVEEGWRFWNGYWNLYGMENCRTFSSRTFDAFRINLGLVGAPPPERPKPQRRWWRRWLDWIMDPLTSTTESSSWWNWRPW